MSEHEHFWIETERYENDDRIRTRETCECGLLRRGCYAKRLDFDGSAAWGPVGEWWYGEPMKRGNLYEDHPYQAFTPEDLAAFVLGED